MRPKTRNDLKSEELENNLRVLQINTQIQDAAKASKAIEVMDDTVDSAVDEAMKGASTGMLKPAELQKLGDNAVAVAGDAIIDTVKNATVSGQDLDKLVSKVASAAGKSIGSIGFGGIINSSLLTSSYYDAIKNGIDTMAYDATNNPDPFYEGWHQVGKTNDYVAVCAKTFPIASPYGSTEQNAAEAAMQASAFGTSCFCDANTSVVTALRFFY